MLLTPLRDIQVRIYSRPDCHLCEGVIEMAQRLQAKIPFELDCVNIDYDSALVARYGTRIPVVTVNQQELGEPVTERDLRRAIKRARWSGPVSRILSRLGLRPKRG